MSSKAAFTPDPRSPGAAATEAPTAELRRTLRFAVTVAAQLERPGQRITGGYAVGEGYYYEVAGEQLTSDQVSKIESRLQELIAAGEAVKAVKKSWAEAAAYFGEHGLEAARALIETRVSAEVECHECHGVLRLALFPLLDTLGPLAGRTSLVPAAPGFVVSYGAGGYAPQPALLDAYRDHIIFAKSHGVASVGALNSLKQVGRSRKDYVLQCEFRQEAKLAEIASRCKEREKAGKPVKVICIAGPTSSGKTTFATKMCMYLQNLGFHAKPLTVDHYYLPLDRQPKYQARQQRSDVDYDHIESMDVDLVGEHLNALVSGKSVMTPVYNMKTGYRDEPGHRFEALPDSGILVIEGIHALNPLYTKTVDADKVFKIFISPLTVLQLDDGNVVKTTYHRLLRRMCRDYLFRGNSASTTLKMWDNVRKGEGVWIFPHQNDADYVMNSAADYEVPVLKTFIEPLLRAVTPEDPNYAKAGELLKLLDSFGTWPPGLSPPAALLREFIGDGAFDCH